jgi:D-alanyl-D-alanine endopeptidase (penicillin-binding protein 7)
MTPIQKSRLRLAALVTALVAAGALVPIVERQRQAPSQVASAPTPGAPEETPPPPAPPGTEVVPPEESETDHGPAALSPTGPTESFGRSAGLKRVPDPLHLNSSVALLIDGASGEVLVQKNDQAKLPIASLTKLMTTLLVLEAKQPMNEVITITSDDVDTERHSRSRLRPGTTLTREEALHLALMSSENRAAHALARYYPGGLPRMVEAMNAKAKQLGMKDTTYVDPTGLSNRNQSTARDLALLVRQASQNPVIRDFSTTPAHLASLGGRTLQYVNSNGLVRNQRSGWDVVMQKTGYIVEAGRCLTMVVREGAHDMIMVLLDSDSNGTRISDAERLRRYSLAQLGLPDTSVAQIREHPATRKVVGTRKKATEGKHKTTTVAHKEGPREKSTHRTGVARRPEGKGEEKSAHAKGGRVRQTFAAAHGEQKS